MSANPERPVLDAIDELVDWQMKDGLRSELEADLLACGYPRDAPYAQARHGHEHSYHCHLGLDNYW